MKKLVIFLFLVVGISSLIFAQSSYPSGYRNFDQSAIYAYGFDGDKPLKRDTKVEVWETLSNGVQICWEMHLAYKGETKGMFIKRFKETFLFQKSTLILKSQLKVKTASVIPSLETEEKKIPTWVFNIVVVLLIILIFWGMFGEVDKDPRSMTSTEKEKYLKNIEKEQAADEKKAQKRELKKITKQLAKELKKKPVL